MHEIDSQHVMTVLRLRHSCRRSLVGLHEILHGAVNVVDAMRSRAQVLRLLLQLRQQRSEAESAGRRHVVGEGGAAGVEGAHAVAQLHQARRRQLHRRHCLGGSQLRLEGLRRAEDEVFLCGRRRATAGVSGGLARAATCRCLCRYERGLFFY